MRPICSPDGRCVRVEIDGDERWGWLDGEEIVLSDGARIAEATAEYLAPGEPVEDPRGAPDLREPRSSSTTRARRRSPRTS